MSNLLGINPELLTIAVICVAVLIITMAVLGHYTGWLRMKHKHYLNPEDAKSFSQMDESEIKTAEHVEVDRGLRAHRNHLESTVPFLAILPLYLLCNPSLLTAKIALIVFTIGRVLFTLCYLKQIQPLRSISFMIAEVALIVMLVQMLVAVL